jgi:hypothetical protein
MEIEPCSPYAESFYNLQQENLEILDFKCKIRTKRREKFYIHSYDPSGIYNEMAKYYDPDEYIEKIYSMFDFEKRKNCCYCISITVYFTKVDKDYFEDQSNKDQSKKPDANKYEYRYLLSILQTVQNAKRYLPEWLVRIYMDQSIYQVLKSKKNKYLCKLIDQIFQSDNVEIFTYDCNVLNIEQTRTYRFLPMIDPTVAKVAVREADGYLCKMDCHNILLFSQMNKIMYLAEYFPNSKSSMDEENDLVYAPEYDMANLWIEIYKDFFQEEYFQEMSNLYSLVAGTITLNVMVNPRVFQSVFVNLKLQIRNFKNAKLIKPSLFESLDIGFDEIFLLDLFKDAISVQKEMDEKEYFMIQRMIEGSLSYPIIKVKGNTIEKCLENLDPLVEDGYLDYVPLIHQNENKIDFLKIVDSAVNLKYKSLFNVVFPDLIIYNPFGSRLEASLLALGNIQYVFIENKIQCVVSNKIKSLNYRDQASPNDPCWNEVLQLLEDMSLIDEVYENEKNFLDQYYHSTISKRKS